MSLHLLKMCVGCDSIRDLESWIAEWDVMTRRLGRPIHYHHTTRHYPKRAGEILDGGSLYWVMKRQIVARQAVLGIEQAVDAGGISRCHIMMDRAVVPVAPRPYRPFQGWRYLEKRDAPPDLSERGRAVLAMPEKLRSELAELGLL